MHDLIYLANLFFILTRMLYFKFMDDFLETIDFQQITFQKPVQWFHICLLLVEEHFIRSFILLAQVL